MNGIIGSSKVLLFDWAVLLSDGNGWSCCCFQLTINKDLGDRFGPTTDLIEVFSLNNMGEERSKDTLFLVQLVKIKFSHST